MYYKKYNTGKRSNNYNYNYNKVYKAITDEGGDDVHNKT